MRTSRSSLSWCWCRQHLYGDVHCTELDKQLMDGLMGAVCRENKSLSPQEALKGRQSSLYAACACAGDTSAKADRKIACACVTAATLGWAHGSLMGMLADCHAVNQLPATCPCPCARPNMVEVLKEKFADLNLTYSIGGQISFDVFPAVRVASHHLSRW